MFQRDYLLKLIEEASYVLARLMGLRQQSKTEEALAYLEQIYDAYFPFTHGSLHQIDPEDLLEVIRNHPKLETDHLSILADLFGEEAELWFQKGQWEKGKVSLEKGIRLLQFLNEADPSLYSFDRMNKLSQWQTRLNDSSVG